MVARTKDSCSRIGAKVVLDILGKMQQQISRDGLLFFRDGSEEHRFRMVTVSADLPIIQQCRCRVIHMWRILPPKLEATNPEMENLISAYRPHFLRNSAFLTR